MPPWLLPGPFRPEFPTDERCAIAELLNDPACAEVSLATACVAAGITTRLHCVVGTAERYVILSGAGVVEVAGMTAPVGPGDCVFIPPGVPQRIRNLGADDLVFHCVCTPRFQPENYRDLGDGPGVETPIGAS